MGMAYYREPGKSTLAMEITGLRNYAEVTGIFIVDDQMRETMRRIAEQEKRRVTILTEELLSTSDPQRPREQRKQLLQNTRGPRAARWS